MITLKYNIISTVTSGKNPKSKEHDTSNDSDKPIAPTHSSWQPGLCG